MLNQCSFIGNLGADPEVRNTQSGSKVVNFRIGVTQKWKDKNSGESRERTEWVPIVVFAEGIARVAEQYLRKGSKVFVQGEFTTRKWTDQSGQDRYSTEVVLRPYTSTLTMLDGRPSGESASGYQEPEGRDLGEEIPF